MNLVDLIINDGFQVKKKAMTQGGEWAGPCPWCGGRDRFLVWPLEGDHGRYWCRSCGQKGDAIQWMRDRHGMGYLDACAALEIAPRQDRFSLPRGRAHRETWTPEKTSPPGPVWAERAEDFVSRSEAMMGIYKPAVEYLQGRGLNLETIRAARLGWNSRDQWQAREAWGLLAEIKENGKPKKLWLPAGIVIPVMKGGVAVRVKVRRSNQDVEQDRKRTPDRDPLRYYALPGSKPDFMALGHGDAVVVVESALDALLVHQEAGDLVSCMAVDSAQAKPDAQAAARLQAAPVVLVALDSDQAGAKAAWTWWTAHVPNARRWPPVGGKDQGEMFQAGKDIRTWVQAGMGFYLEGTKNG